MTTGIEKFKLDSKIAVSFYKHRGDIEGISNDLDIDADYIKKVTDKLKRKMRKDVSVHVAVSIMETIHIGYQQRVAHLNECINKLRNSEEADVSVCCKAITQTKNEGGADVVYCLKCNTQTHLQRIQRTEIYKLIQEFGRELREEDKHLLEFAVKMGFTAQDTPVQNIYRQNIVVLGNQKSDTINISEEDKVIMKDIDRMTPLERQRMRRTIESKILEEEDKDEEGKNDVSTSNNGTGIEETNK